jgi:hypothetical protein
VLTAFLAHRLDVPYGTRARHFRDEFREEVHFGPRSLKHFVTGKHQFLKHDLGRRT